MYDAATGRFLTHEAIAEAHRDFGGIDYLHLFDWGNLPGKGRVYGRDGDLDPFGSFAGGREALAEAIRSVRDAGVPVGLYIEGYLLEEHGKLGAQQGRRWQLINAEGERSYWPDSSEMFICPALPRWEAIQGSTFARTARILSADGMYIDPFGFAGADKDCHSPDHGHEVPSYAVTAERQVTRAVRNAMAQAGSDAVLYSEETPVDVVTQYQDGSFTYAMHAVYTLLNTRHRTVRGPILRLPHDPAAAYHDAWHDRPAQVVRCGSWDVVSTELGPHGAGCIVVERVDSPAPAGREPVARDAPGQSFSSAMSSCHVVYTDRFSALTSHQPRKDSRDGHHASFSVRCQSRSGLSRIGADRRCP